MTVNPSIGNGPDAKPPVGVYAQMCYFTEKLDSAISARKYAHIEANFLIIIFFIYFFCLEMMSDTHPKWSTAKQMTTWATCEQNIYHCWGQMSASLNHFLPGCVSVAASGAQAEGETSYQMAEATSCRWCMEWGMWLYSQVVMDFVGGTKYEGFFMRVH